MRFLLLTLPSPARNWHNRELEYLEVTAKGMGLQTRKLRRPVAQCLAKSSGPSSLKHPHIGSRSRGVGTQHFLPLARERLCREDALVRASRDHPESAALKRLKARDGIVDADRFLPAKIVPQLQSGGRIDKNQIRRRNFPMNKLHSMVHVFVPLVSQRQHIPPLQRSENAAHDDDGDSQNDSWPGFLSRDSSQ